MKDHDEAVEAFFAKCAAERPAETARVFAQYPVLTERQLDDRRKRELHAFGPEDDEESDGFDPGGTLTAVASLRAHEQEMDRARVARLRGEPV